MSNSENEKDLNNSCCNHDHEECGCGCDCSDEEAAIVELEDENGDIVKCQVVDEFEFKDQDFILVQNPTDQSVYLFKVVDDEEEGHLIVPDDDEFNEASAYYETLLENEEE